VRRLHAGFAVVFVIEHGDGEIHAVADAHRSERSQAHEQFTIAGQDQHWAPGLCDREPKANRDSTSHSTPERKRKRVIPSISRIPGGGSETGDDEQFAPISEQRFHYGAAIQPPCRWLHHVSLHEGLSAEHALPDENGRRPQRVISDTKRPFHLWHYFAFLLCSADKHIHRFEHNVSGPAHWHLPGIELTPIATHRDQHRQWDLAYRQHGEHVDAIAYA